MGVRTLLRVLVRARAHAFANICVRLCRGLCARVRVHMCMRMRVRVWFRAFEHTFAYGRTRANVHALERAGPLAEAVRVAFGRIQNRMQKDVLEFQLGPPNALAHDICTCISLSARLTLRLMACAHAGLALARVLAHCTCMCLHACSSTHVLGARGYHRLVAQSSSNLH